MTEEQQRLAADNHGLIFHFLQLRNLPADEFYDVAAIGLCNAAMYYNGKYKFSSFAYKCMWNEICKIFQANNTQKRKADKPVASLDYSEEYEKTQGFDCTEESALGNIYAAETIKRFSSVEQRIVEMLLDGFNQHEISENLGMTQQNISLIKARLRKKLKNIGVIA